MQFHISNVRGGPAVSAGTQQAVPTSLVLANSNGVTFGLSASSQVTGSVAAGATATGNLGALSAGTQLASSGTVVLSDSNGLTFGMSASTRVTGSHDGLRSVSAGTQDSNVTRLVLSNANGVTFGLSNGTVTASVAAGGGGVAISAAGNSVSNGTVLFSNANGVTFGMAGSTVTASVNAGAAGATISGFEPQGLLNAATTTHAPGLGTWYLQPFVLQANLASGRLNALHVSYSNSSAGVLRATNAAASFASNTTGTRSATYDEAWTAALYSRGGGASSTQIERFWSNTWSRGITHQVSVVLTNATQVRVTNSASMAYVASVGSDGAYTTAGITAGGSRSSGAASMASSAVSSVMSSLLNMLTGQLAIPLGFNTSLGPGMYWLGIARSTSLTTAGSSIQDPLPLVNRQMLYGLTSMPHRLFGLTVSNTSSQYFPGYGIYSVVSSAPPATIQFTQIRSVASHVRCYFNVLNLPV